MTYRRQGQAALRRLLLAAALLAAASAAASCGGSASENASAPATPQTFVDVVALDNSICGATGTKVATVAPPAFTPHSVTTAKLPTAVNYLDQVLPLLQSEYSQIMAIDRPATMTSAQTKLYDGVLASLTTLLADERTARDAAAAGSIKRFKHALSTQETDSRHLTGLAVQTGLTTCAGS